MYVGRDEGVAASHGALFSGQGISRRCGASGLGRRPTGGGGTGIHGGLLWVGRCADSAGFVEARICARCGLASMSGRGGLGSNRRKTTARFEPVHGLGGVIVVDTAAGLLPVPVPVLRAPCLAEARRGEAGLDPLATRGQAQFADA